MTTPVTPLVLQETKVKATQLLKAQHKAAKKIFLELEKGRAVNAPSRVKELVSNLGAHMVIEQELFYPAVKAIKPDLVLESFEEHAAAQFGVERLLRTGPDDESFLPRVTTLKEMIEHHVQEEEETLFLSVEKKMEASKLEALGEAMQQRFEELLGEGNFRGTLETAELEQPMPTELG